MKKLLHRGQGWLSAHPARELIVSRYLKHRTGLARLTEEDMVQADLASSEHDVEEAVMEKAISLHEQRLGAAVAVLKNSGAKRGVDLGCGEGKLLTLLLREPQFSHILRMDVSSKALEFAAERLHLDRLPAKQRERVELIQGSLMYRDPRFNGFDAAVVEVIEHLDPPRLAAFERVLFEFARPKTVVLTTPAKLDLSFLRDLVKRCYSTSMGRPSIDPVVFFKLQLIMFFEGIRSERQLMEIVNLNLAHRWYIGYDLDEDIPDHSSLTKIRDRYGLETFQRFFDNIVEQCIEAGLVWGQELYFDGTKVQANADIDTMVPRFYFEAKQQMKALFG